LLSKGIITYKPTITDKAEVKDFFIVFFTSTPEKRKNCGEGQRTPRPSHSILERKEQGLPLPTILGYRGKSLQINSNLIETDSKK